MSGNYETEFLFVNGDANHDGKVEVADLGIIASNWQKTQQTYANGDFNYDRMVDAADLGILASNWQFELEPVPSSASRRGMSTTRRAVTSTAIELLESTQT